MFPRSMVVYRADQVAGIASSTATGRINLCDTDSLSMLTGHKSPQPLRDRLFSPDPLKSSILRESGMGWSSPPPEVNDSQINGSITSPLRIAKRESPRPPGAQLARRTSSSYRHVHNNNLVTKSPFKSQIPTPSTPSRPSSVAFPITRRVSGEKRPRPKSIHEQTETENERPFALKRERRQSKGFQDLLEKEPVSKSPFRLQQSCTSSQTPPPIPSTSESRLPVPSSQSSGSSAALRSQTPSPNTGPSPARSSLVSRRLHGPRRSGSYRRERRKTVTFDERCDVVEFAPDEDEDEEAFASADDEMYGDVSDQQDDDDDAFFYGIPSNSSQPAVDVPDEDASFDSIHLSDIETEIDNPSLLQVDSDTSITRLTDEMFASNSATGETSIPLRYSTPPRITDIPPDLEMEDGVPLGRSHHVERSIQHHQQQQQSPHFAPPVFSANLSPEQSHRCSPLGTDSPSGYPFNIGISPRASPLNQTPRRSRVVATSTPPLRHSTHVECIQKGREEEIISDLGMDNDLGKLPVSPSPMKKATTRDTSDVDVLIPPFDIMEETRSTPPQPSSGSDSFTRPKGSYPMHEDEPREDSFSLSIGNSEISLTGLGRDPEALIASVEREQRKTPSEGDPVFREEPLRSLSPRPGTVEGTRLSPSAREHSGSPIPRMSSPLFRGTSPLSSNRNRSGSNASLTGRQRITRENVQKRLLKRRSFGSPAPEVEPELKHGEDKLITRERYDAEMAERVLVDVEKSHEHETKESITLFPGNTDRRDSAQFFPGILPMGGKSASPTTEEDEASDELESLGILERMSESDAKMGSGSSGTSGSSSSSSATAVETSNVPNIKLEFNDVDMDMKSALDRLMDDVAGVGGRKREDSMMTECDLFEADAGPAPKSNRAPLSRAMTEPTPLLHTSTGIGFSPDKDKSDSSIDATPPPVPLKDNIRAREQLILEKRREMRQLEAEADEELEHSKEYSRPPRPDVEAKSKNTQQQLLGVGRPSKRRSMSTGDADLLCRRNGEGMLDGVMGEAENNDALADSIEKEFRKLAEPQRKAKYQVREREGTIYASSSDPDGVSHIAGPGDVNTGKAWRTVRRPSDMNVYAKQIREYRAQVKPGKAYGKVFVKILGIKNMHLPLPQQSTSVTCTLNNGIHFVTTPESQLGQNTRIDQEFELIEQNKLEFTLTLKVKRDPHIIAQFKALSPPPPPPPAPVVQAPSKGGMRSFFYSTPKKAAKVQAAAATPPLVHRLPENLARYMKSDGTLARVFVAFKDIAARCDTRLFETSYPLIGQRLEVGGKFSAQQVGELVLQIFRLPPLPGIGPEQLPQSLDECCRGLRHINWHKVTYFEGTLTQNGGDCTTWRRRRFRVIGAALVAFNDVTKKATATIDLKKAIAIEDDQQGRGIAMGPSSSRSTRYGDEYDVLCGVERSFRLIFPKDEEIVFFADSDEEKAKWLEIFRALVGHIPPHPLWGELLWQRQEELTKRVQAQVSPQTSSHPLPHEARRNPQ